MVNILLRILIRLKGGIFRQISTNNILHLSNIQLRLMAMVCPFSSSHLYRATHQHKVMVYLLDLLHCDIVHHLGNTHQMPLMLLLRDHKSTNTLVRDTKSSIADWLGYYG